MNIRRGGALTVLVLLVTVGCGGSSASLPGQDGEGEGTESTTDATGPAGPAGPSEIGGEAQAGIFVSATKGVQGGDGTKARPVKTIAEGIALAVEQHLPVNVCAETYAEAVKLVDGVTLFGYFDCSNSEKWVKGSAKAKIASPTSPAVLGEKLELPATFAGFAVEGPDMAGPATDTAASSYGMVLRASKNLTLSEVTIRGGKGQDGIDGVEPEPNAELSDKPTGAPSTAPLKQDCKLIKLGDAFLDDCKFGSPITVQFINAISGEAGGVSQCKVGPNGGPGGQGGGGCISDKRELKACTQDDASGRSLASDNDPHTALGGIASDNIGANPGAKGAAGAGGTMGSNGSWSFSGDAVFIPGDGTTGTNGSPGQGGGGGAGSRHHGLVQIPPSGGRRGMSKPSAPNDGIWRSATGAGGGAGGCGGLAGTAGKGGGASIGLFVVDSSAIVVLNSKIEGKQGGRAGKGANGTDGLSGHAGGPRSGSYAGSAGGKGGDGGHGGLSGHGAPGPSIALVFKGERPKTTSVTLVGGVGGGGFPAHVEGSQTRPAVVGEVKEELSL